jgi:oxygen-dependent protoporphyrinogen oxidase
MTTMTDELASSLGANLRLRDPVEGIATADGAWVLHTPSGPLHADAVVLTLDAAATRHLLEPVARDVSADLEQIPNVSIGLVLMVYPEGTAERLPAGTGFVAPDGATPMSACTWTSSVWPEPGFGTRAVLRCIVGAAGEEALLEADDAEIVEACARHIAALVPLPERPDASAVVRWPDAVPRYRLGHVARVARIRERLPAGIFVSGRAFDGIDVAECVRGATETAEGVRAFVTSDDRERIR